MKLILLKEVEGLGKRGSLVHVADGFGRNYLIPKGLALLDTMNNRKTVDSENRMKQLKMDKEKRDSEKVRGALEKISLTTIVQVGEGDRLFGSVTAEDISLLLKKEGISIDKRKIHLSDPIKELGVYTIPIKLHAEVEGSVKLWVVRE